MPDTIKIQKDSRKGTVARSSFESVWKHKGWKEAKDEDQESTGGADEEAVKAAQKEQEKALKESNKKS